jgi:hypothetical protein
MQTSTPAQKKFPEIYVTEPLFLLSQAHLQQQELIGYLQPHIQIFLFSLSFFFSFFFFFFGAIPSMGVKPVFGSTVMLGIKTS